MINNAITKDVEKKADYKDICKNGLWKNNSALVQVLGLCPLLAVSTSVVNALGLGLATLIVITASNTAVSLIRNYINDTVRFPVFMLIIAALVCCVELMMKAYTYELYQILGIFVPLIVSNCAILGRAETFASKTTVIPAALDGFMMGLGFILVLVCVGAIREILGTGIIFNNMQLLFGDVAATWKLNVFGNNYPGVPLALLPPGAFIVVGFLIASKNYIDTYLKDKAKGKAEPVTIVKGSKRVRTTGHIV